MQHLRAFAVLTTFTLFACGSVHPGAGDDTAATDASGDDGLDPPDAGTIEPPDAEVAPTPDAEPPPPECTTSADCDDPARPACDAGACRGCEAGDECTSGECHLDTGACYAANELIYLAPSGNDAGTCNKLHPCATFARARQLLTATRGTITLTPGTYVEDIIFTLSADIFGHGATLRARTAGWYAFYITLDAQVHLSDAIIDEPPGAPAIRCDTASANLEDVATPGAVGAENCDLHLTRFASSGGLTALNGMTTIRASSFVGGTGVRVSYGTFDITNSVFSRITNGVVFVYGPPTGPHRFESNTVVDNGTAAMAGRTLDVDCQGGVPQAFRNNIIWTSFTPGAGSLVTTCWHSYSLIYTGSSTPYFGFANITGDPRFVRTQPIGTLPIDLHLLAGSPAINAGDPAAVLADDVDGGARPVGPRADIGADEYTP